MAKTGFDDIIVPEVFSDYVDLRTATLSNLRTSGIAVVDPVIQARAQGGGDYVNLPFWNDLSGDSELLPDGSDDAALTPAQITAGSDVAVKQFRGKSWASNDMAGWVAGDDPMRSIGDRVANYWVRDEQTRLVKVLTGLFATSGALATTHSLDVSTADTPTPISGEAIVNAAQKLGDAAGGLMAIMMHSYNYAILQKAQLIEYLRDPLTNIDLPYYLGRRVIVDDACPTANSGKQYDSFLFGPGAIAYATVSLGGKETETDRDSLQGDDILISRRAIILHPRGVAYQSGTDARNPTNTVLATASSWAKVYADKQIRIVRLRTGQNN